VGVIPGGVGVGEWGGSHSHDSEVGRSGGFMRIWCRFKLRDGAIFSQKFVCLFVNFVSGTNRTNHALLRDPHVQDLTC
jgi:hypothetical protein